MTEKSMREKMLAGEPYIGDDPELAEMSLRCADLCAAYDATLPQQRELRRELLAQMLGSVGEGVTIRGPVQFDDGVHTHIGDRTFINRGQNAVVGARAVVTKDLPANVVAVGNPARVVKQID